MKQYLKKRYLENSLLLLLIIFGGACKVVAAYFIGDGFNELIKLNTDGFFYNIAYAGIVFLLYLVSLYIKIPYENYVVQKMITDIRCDVVDAITKNNYANFNKKNSGDYISWLSNDLMIVEEKGFGNFYQSITAIIETLLAIVGLFAFHWSIIVFSIVMSVLTLALPALVQKSIQNKAQRYSGSLEKLISKNTNYLQGFDSLLSFNKLGILKKIVENSSNEVLKESVSLRKSVGLAGVLGGLGNLVGQVGVVLLTGILALKNIVGFGSILTVESLTSTIFNSVGNIMNITVELNIVVPIFEKFEKFKEDAKVINDQDTSKKLLNEEEGVLYRSEQGKILTVLWGSVDGRATSTDIAIKTGLANNTLTSMIEKLIQQGLVSCEHCTKDKRKKYIILTQLGWSQKEIGDRVSKKLADIFYEGFQNEEIKQFEKFQERILDNLVSFDKR